MYGLQLISLLDIYREAIHLHLTTHSSKAYAQQLTNNAQVWGPAEIGCEI